MQEYAVKAQIRLILQNFHKFSGKEQEAAYEGVFEEIYIRNAGLDDTMYMKIDSPSDGTRILNLLKEEPEPPKIYEAKSTGLTYEYKVSITPDKLLDPVIKQLTPVLVPSSTNPSKKYTVSKDERNYAVSCTCMDYVVRKNKYCKHMAGVDSGKYR